MSLANIRTKIDEALATVEGLNHADKVPSVVNPPFAYPSLRPTDPVSYDVTAQNGVLVYHFIIDILVQKGTSVEQAQDDIDPYLQSSGDYSIRAALETIDWGSDAQTHRLLGVSNYGPVAFNGTEYLCARLGLDIWV